MRAWQSARHCAAAELHEASLLAQIFAQMGCVPDGLTPLLPAQLEAQSSTRFGNCGWGQQSEPELQVPPLARSRRQVAHWEVMPATRTWQSGWHVITSVAQAASLLVQREAQRGSSDPSPVW
jgi:hypothetical protein